ncbi:MAG: hypothetical protein ABSA11_12985 [Candidatus Bathyarchaeia archaeon]
MAPNPKDLYLVDSYILKALLLFTNTGPYKNWRKLVKRMKYVYLCFTKWSDKAVAEWPKKGAQWLKKHEKLCKDNKVEIVTNGRVFGCVEDTVIGYATDMHRDAFQDFRDKVWNLDPEIPMSYTKTYEVLQF